MPTEQPNIEIWKIERQYLKGEVLSPDQMQCAEDAALAANVDEAVIGCEVLLGHECTNYQKALASRRLADLCSAALAAHDLTQPTLVLATLLIPQSEFETNPVFREFAHECATAEDVRCRINAMLLLERLVRIGDSKAVDILMASQSDPHESVRRNARTCLARIKPEQG